MASKVEICNLALTHIGVGKEIANLETEVSQEAQSLRRVYEPALKLVLRRCNWPFATKIAALALVEEEPNTEWGYSYRYPVDCLKIRRVLSGLRNDTRASRMPVKMAQDASGTLIFTDQEGAEVEYTLYADNPQFYPPDFVMAFSYYLGSLIAPRLTKGDPYKLGPKAMAAYELEIGRAAATAFNEQQDEEEPDSESLEARN